MGPATKAHKERNIPPISLTLIPVNPKNELKTWNFEEYNALDKMKDFAEKAAFDLPKKKEKYNFDFTLIKANANKQTDKDQMKQLFESYSRINEFIKGCDWTNLKIESKQPKEVELKYLEAKREYMIRNLNLIAKEQKSVLREPIELENRLLGDIIGKRDKGVHTYKLGRDGALSISVHPKGSSKDGLVRFSV